MCICPVKSLSKINGKQFLGYWHFTVFKDQEIRDHFAIFGNHMGSSIPGPKKLNQLFLITRQLGRPRYPPTGSEANTAFFVYIYIGYRFPLSPSTIWGNHLPFNQ